MMKEIADHTKKQKYTLCSCIEGINIVKMAILHRAIYRFKTIPNQIPMTFFTKLEQIILKFIGAEERPQITKAILSKKNKEGSIDLLGFRLYYKILVIKTTLCWYKSILIDTWSKIEHS